MQRTFPTKSFNFLMFFSHLYRNKKDTFELPTRSSVIDICVEMKRKKHLRKHLHITWFMETTRMEKIYITLFYCRLLSLVQMVKITIISSYETSFFGSQHKKKFSLIVKSITLSYRSEAFVMPMLSN